MSCFNFAKFLFLVHDDDSRSLQLSESTPRTRTTYADDGYSGNLPPDLLAFPTRFQQSPSIQSSISNIHDGRIYGKSPMTSPIFGQNDFGQAQIPHSGYRTLQHPKNGRTMAFNNCMWNTFKHNVIFLKIFFCLSNWITSK